MPVQDSDYSFEFLIDELIKKFKSRESRIADLEVRKDIEKRYIRCLEIQEKEKNNRIYNLEKMIKSLDELIERLINDQIHQCETIQNLRDTIIKLKDKLSEYEKPSVREIVMEEIRLKNEEDDLK